VVALTAALVVIVASAQAAPALKKNFEASVRVNDASLPNVFRLTLKNDSASQQTLGSAQFTLPAGFTINGSPTSLTAGFNVTAVGTTIVQFGAVSSGTALRAGGIAEALVTVVKSTLSVQNDPSSTAAWTAKAKQSNDFSGSGNDFTPLPVSSDKTFTSDLVPLGSFAIATIATVDDALYPTVLTHEAFPFVTSAYDTCGALKTTYSGAGLTYSFLTDATFAVGIKALNPDDYGTKAWSGGIADVDVTPIFTETPNTLTVTDGPTAIAATSNSFDVVDLACTKNTNPCVWPCADGKITAWGAPPTTDGTSLGIGYNSHIAPTFTCGSSTSVVGGQVFNINPRNYGSDDTTFQVTLTYTKQASGSGPASSFPVCLLKHMPTASTDWTDPANAYNNGAPIGACPTNPTAADAPCVISKKRTSSGALQVILFLKQGDPWGGTGFG
jgi:hypothetical protein